MGRGNKLILIVDDEEIIREILKEMLHLEGYKTLEAENGMAALDVLESNPVDLVISDIRMPKLDGLELLKKIRHKNPDYPPVVLVTGYTDYTESNILMHGAKKIIHKPFTYEAIVKMVNEVL